jgi:hypothetical protein
LNWLENKNSCSGGSKTHAPERIPTEEWAISLSLGHDGLRDNSSKASIDYLVVAARTFITKILFPKLLKSTVKRAASTKKSSLRSPV